MTFAKQRDKSVLNLIFRVFFFSLSSFDKLAAFKLEII